MCMYLFFVDVVPFRRTDKILSLDVVVRCAVQLVSCFFVGGVVATAGFKPTNQTPC